MEQFYKRLLRRQRPEAIIVVLFLLLIMLLQLNSPKLFRAPDDLEDIKEKHRPMVTLSHQEAMWEVLILQEKAKKYKEEIAALKNEIKLLNENSEIPSPPMRTNISKELWNAIPYKTFDQHGVYAISNDINQDSAVPQGGLRSTLIEEFNSLGIYICKLYNTNPRGGMFYRTLRGNSEPGNMTESHFQTGIYRYIPTIGIEYQLFFRDPSPLDVTDHLIYRIKVDRPFEQPPYFTVEHVNSHRKAINIVVPLMGRLKRFEEFLLNLVRLKQSLDFNLHLSLSYFGNDGLAKVNQLISNAKNLGFTNIKLIHMPNEVFSRGLGQQRAIEKWHNGNDVMFLSDVDLIIRPNFLERCVIYAEKGRSVYYPTVFSLFNPDIVNFFHYKRSKDQADSEWLRTSSQYGFWRSFGYGMLCVHQTDYFRVGGYRKWKRQDADHEWGNEDVDLYTRFVKHSKIKVIRAPDPDLFHKWHPKDCPKDLTPEKRKQCQTSMAANEGSYKQLGLLHFDEIYNKFIKSNRTISLKTIQTE